jgi:hypothetical protein
MLAPWSCGRWPTPRAWTSRRRSRSRVSRPLQILFVAWICRDPLSTYLPFALSPVDRSLGVDDVGGGTPGGLQLRPVGARGSAVGSSRGVPKHKQGCRAGRELYGESPPGLGRPCSQAYARCAPPGDPKDPRRGAVALPGQPCGAGHELCCRRRPRRRRAQDEASRLDALAAPTTDILADDFEEVLFSNVPPPSPSSPESSWALRPLGYSQKSSRAALCNLRQFA